MLCLYTAPPKIHVPPRFIDTATFEKGENIVIKIPFTGNPKPTVKWLRDNDEIKNNDKFKVRRLAWFTNQSEQTVLQVCKLYIKWILKGIYLMTDCDIEKELSRPSVTQL